MKKKELKNEDLEKVTGGTEEPENTNLGSVSPQIVATTGLLPLGSTGSNDHGYFIIGSTGCNDNGAIIIDSADSNDHSLAPLPR